MKFGYTIIYVPSVVTTMDFYKAAFGLKKRFLHESQLYGELDTGATTLAFADESMHESNEVFTQVNRSATPLPPGIEIALVTANVEQAYKQAINAGAIAVKAPQEKPWGQTVAFVRDINGVLVEICSPVEG
jgi:lactoylglutathione lyase